MSAVEFVAVIVGVFFVIGVGFGIISVIAMSAIRNDRERHVGRPREFGHGDDETGWAEPPGPGDEDGGYPRWPGGFGGLTAAARVTLAC